MKEFKFRGYSLRLGDFVYGDLIHVKEGIRIVDSKTLLPMFVDPETVSQFTGYKDDDGKEIYFGDTVRITYYDRWDWESKNKYKTVEGQVVEPKITKCQIRLHHVIVDQNGKEIMMEDNEYESPVTLNSMYSWRDDENDKTSVKLIGHNSPVEVK